MSKNQTNIFDEKIFIEYQKKYYENSNFSEILINALNYEENIINYPVTIVSNENQKILNSYNNAIFLDNLNLNPSSYKKVLQDLKNILKKEGIKKIQFKKEFKEDELELKLSGNKEPIDFIGIESIINLENSLDVIKQNFSKGHKSALKIDYKNLTYEIFDKNNYQKNQIFEMMELHKKVSGKSTRSKQTWIINEKMVQSDNGFLIRVKDDNKIISYSFIFFNKKFSIYFSSCTLRENFKTYKNISHKSIWEAIKYLKLKKCQKFSLGVTKTFYSKDLVDEKNKNIALFKSSFGGERKYFIIYNRIPN